MNKRRWNKYISIMISAVMLATILVGNGITVAAAQVDTVDLTVSPELLLAGATYTDANYDKSNVTVSSGNCTVESIKWTDAGGNPLVDGMQLEEGNTYQTIITLKANDGDCFTPDTTVTFNGNTVVYYLNRYDSDGYNRLDIEYDIEPTVISYIGNINLTVPEATIGNTADTYSYTHNEDGVDQYTVTGLWYEYDASAREYKPMASTEMFKADGGYQLQLCLKSMPGYVFGFSDINVNNSWVVMNTLSSLECSANLYYSFGIEISEVEFTISDPVEGQSFSNTNPIKATVPSGSNYTVEGNWVDEEGNTTGTFTKGKEYYFQSTFYADDGYCFAKDIDVYVTDSCLEWSEGRGKIAHYTYRKSLKIPIDEVILNNVPKAEIGKPLKIGEFQIEVPADAKYQATGLWWDETGAPITSTTVKEDKRYALEIWLYADNEYEFAAPYILKINGVAHRRDGGHSDDMYMLEYSFLEQIREIEVTGVVEPVVGQAPSTNTLKPADPTKYEITSAGWFDSENGSVPTKFENGRMYELQVCVQAKLGYEIAPYASWKMGKENGVTTSTAVSQWYIGSFYSFEPIISEIRVNGIPSMKVGESAGTVNLSVPNDANYTAQADWIVWNDNKGTFELFAGTFEQGKTYRLSIRVNSNIGYRFEEDVTACYFDGVLNEDVTINERLAHYGIDFAQQGAKVINKVELNIKKWVAGEHASVNPIITVPEDANYRQDQNGLWGWVCGDIHKIWNFDSYFEEDGNYGVSVGLVANEGYVFAKDLVVVVNGIAISAQAYTVNSAKETDVRYFFDMTCQHIFENGKCIACGALEAKSPQTGDSTNLMMWFVVLFVSGTGVFGLSRNERRRKLTNK